VHVGHIFEHRLPVQLKLEVVFRIVLGRDLVVNVIKLVFSSQSNQELLHLYSIIDARYFVLVAYELNGKFPTRQVQTLVSFTW